MTTQPFNPPPEDVPRILDDLASPECSLREIAEAYETSIDGLTLWLARPDIAERFAAAESFAARRTRHAAERHQLDALPLAAQHPSTAHVTDNPSLAALELQRRICETARQASSLLLRLARFEHGPPRPRPTPSTDHAAPARVPTVAPAPASEAAPPPASPLCALSASARDCSDLPTPALTAELAPEPSPPTSSLLCALSASARTSSEPPTTPRPAIYHTVNHFAPPRARNIAKPGAAALLTHAGAPPRPP